MAVRTRIGSACIFFVVFLVVVVVVAVITVVGLFQLSPPIILRLDC